MTGLIHNEQNTAISKHFTKLGKYTSTTSGTIFSVDVLIRGGQVIFHYKPALLKNYLYWSDFIGQPVMLHSK